MSILAWHDLTLTEDRGLSLTAARRIPAGTLIFSEPPLIKISLAEESEDGAIDLAFKKLSKPERKQYLQLFNAKTSISEVVGIYNSNCYDIKAFDDQGGSCIGDICSRINHSCLPNVLFSYIPPERLPIEMLIGMPPCRQDKARQEGLMQFRAIKDISKGKELLSNYEKSIFAPRRTRIERLRRYYGFDCSCEACAPSSDFWDKSDQRRRRMEQCIETAARLEKSWVILVEGSGILRAQRAPNHYGGQVELCNQAIDVLVELSNLTTKEGLTYTPLANCYKSIARWSARNNVDPVPWMRKELEVVNRCFGSQSSRFLVLSRIVVSYSTGGVLVD